MPTSQNSNASRRHQRKLALALVAGGLVACGGGNGPFHVDPEGYDGISEETFPLLANNCTINSGTTTMSLQVRGGETLYLTMRAADGMVVAAAQTAQATECAVPSTYKIAVTEDSAHTGVEKVFLDYINGPFAVGTSAGQTVTPGISIALGATSTMVLRGSSGVDKVYLGSTYTASVLTHSWINVNGDTTPDVRFDGITDVKVSTGVGADIISADGGNGTTGTALDQTITFSAFGGPDADTLTGGKGPSTLNGGDGDDKFIQTATLGPDNIVGGKGFDTVDYTVRTATVNVTVCTTCAPSDPCSCVATDTTCRATPDATQTSCIATANTAQTTCQGTPDSAQTACIATANTAQTTCQGTPDATQTTCIATADGDQTTCNNTADATQATCTAACAPGDTTCTGLCDATHTSDLAACTATHTSDLAACQATRDATCAGIHTSDLAACQTARNATCDAAETTCQQSCGMPACAQCIGDDGASGEGDTVNDDVEIVLGGKGNDSISAFWAPCSDQAASPTVKCTLKGNDGDDTLIGSSHNDLIDGGNGNDTLQGGLGDDTLIGGAGVDTVSYADRSTPVKVSLDSTRLWVTGQNGAAGELDSIASDIENLTGGGGDDFLRGNANANIIHGGAGNDTIEGGAGNDALYGDAGNDLLYGGAGNDMLVGGAGTDTLVGGDGDDFIDSTDSPAANDTLIDCDGVNDSAGTAGTSPGTADALVKDGSDTGAQRCEL